MGAVWCERRARQAADISETADRSRSEVQGVASGAAADRGPAATAAQDGRGGRAVDGGREQRLWHISGPAGRTAKGDREGANEAGDLEGREVRIGASGAVFKNGALELRKSKQGKGEAWVRVGN